MTARKQSKAKPEPQGSGTSEPLKAQLSRWAASTNARPELWSYRTTRNGAHVLRAFLIYREMGAPVPDNVMRWLEQMARRALEASNPAEVAAALEFQNEKRRGGAGGGTRARQTARKVALLMEIQSEFARREDARKPHRDFRSKTTNAKMLAVRERTLNARAQLAALTDAELIASVAASHEYSAASAKQIWHRYRRKYKPKQ